MQGDKTSEMAEVELVPLPAGMPKPHDMEAWARSMKAQFLANDVAEAAIEVDEIGRIR